VRRIAAAVLASFAVAAPASAATTASVEPVGQKWVQVNECGGGSMGVRAAQPGDSFDRPMATRFSAQWLNPANGAWQAVPGSASPWLLAGTGPWLTRETGWTRSFSPGTPGEAFTLRGVVEMQWRGRSGGVARAETLTTPQTCVLR
jgi:hypothetical protein